MRLIDADALKATLSNEPNYIDDGAIFEQFEKIIDNAPTIELDEVTIQKILRPRCMSVVTDEFLIDAIAHKRVPDDSFTIEELSAWLREVMINNSDNSLGDACIDIHDRLDGFVRFCKDRRAEA